jgi:hypothetical protein
MSFEESPWEREDREIHEAFRAKDAEIDRLRVWCNEALDQRDKSAAEIERMLTKNEKEKNLLLTVLDKQTTEIEQLKAILDNEHAEMRIKNVLITELADAMESIPATAHWDWSVKLIQRAREAGKE